jgi:hypothetical protein
MHVILRLLRQIVIEDVAHLGDVQTARSHICGDQHRILARFEMRQQLLALVLRNITGEDRGAITVTLQITPDTISHSLGIDEDDTACGLILFHQAEQ